MIQYGDESFLRVRDGNVKFNNLQILQNINLTAKSGNVLAILGPSGSGKTTTLNFISGRLKVVPGRQTVVSGQVTVNDVPLNKQLRRRLGYVLQEDVLFPNLTLWETLYFTTMIRLPEKETYENKIARLNEVIDILELRGCLNTKI